MSAYSQKDILQAARQAVEKKGGPVTLEEFARLARIPRNTVYKVFPKGGWAAVKRRSGIPFRKDARAWRMSEDEILAQYHRAVGELGHFPKERYLHKHPVLSPNLLRRHFGKKPQLLRRYKEWLERNHPDSEFLAMLNENPRALAPAYGGGPRGGRQVIFGDPVFTPGLLHAPTNEMGVIHLFGMMCWKLGYIVESLRTAFPDCEAKRCIDRQNGRWQRVRIEFEFATSHFQRHGHDPRGCDLIVCWIHDWPACPVEVLELSSVLHKCFPPELVLLRQKPDPLVSNNGAPAPAPQSSDGA